MLGTIFKLERPSGKSHRLGTLDRDVRANDAGGSGDAVLMALRRRIPARSGLDKNPVTRVKHRAADEAMVFALA